MNYKTLHTKFSVWHRNCIGPIAVCIIITMLYPLPLHAGKNHLIEPQPSRFLVIEPASIPNLSPGDTISLLAGNYLQILIRHVHGNSDSAIVIRNHGGQAIISNTSNYGMAFHTCTHVKLIGNGCQEHEYGILIAATQGNGISFDHQSSNLEMTRVEVSNTGLSGIMVKTDPRCDDPATTREFFTMHDIHIHENLIRNTGNEGLYIGSSYYHPGMQTTCNGGDTILLPHEIHGVRIYKNVLHQTGRNAIQVSSATKACMIADNLVVEDSQRAITYHMNGIQVGGGSRCNVYNNQIIDGKGTGIHYFGMGPAMIYNNLIVNPGRTHFPGLPASEHPVHGIFVKHIFSETTDPIHLFHNTIVNPRTDGIQFENHYAHHSRIQNNLLVNPGAYVHIMNEAFIRIHEACQNTTASHNYFSLNPADVHFAAPLLMDFSLLPHSPVINKGIDLQAFGVDSDIMGETRPYGEVSDIGAYEYQGISQTESPNDAGLYIFPNPAGEEINLLFSFQTDEMVSIRVFDVTGKLVLSMQRERCCAHDRFPVAHLSQGVYLVKVQTNSYRASGTFIKK